MSYLRLLFALLIVVVLALASSPAAMAGRCPNAFYAPSTGTCGMTGETCGGGCVYDCENGTYCFAF
jgi:hypothetical protein